MKQANANKHTRSARPSCARAYTQASHATREQAMRGMTIWAAKAAFEEKEKGNLEPGKSADFIMIDNDLMNCDPQKILKTKVLMTFINGERVY